MLLNFKFNFPPMKLLPKFVLFLLFTNSLLFSDLVMAQVEPDCPPWIYSTGRFLGWGSALLECTRSREAPSPFDQIIIEQLQEASNSVERAALACEPAIPAWPDWRQKQSYLAFKIKELQSITSHKIARGRVYHNVNSTYHSWATGLSIKEVNVEGTRNVIRTRTCSTCYFQLGFSTAYATQAFRQGEEALIEFNDIKGAKRQMKLAANYLARTLDVLRKYHNLGCINLRDLYLESRINSLIRLSQDYNNVVKCVQQAGSISDDILVELSNGSSVSSPNATNSYEYCRSKYCPECDNSIVLLETAVDENCQRCLDKNKELISKCMNNNNVSDIYIEDKNIKPQEGMGNIYSQNYNPNFTNVKASWEGSWSIKSLHNTGRFKGNSSRNTLVIKFINGVPKVKFANVDVKIIEISSTVLVYDVIAGGNNVTTTLNRVGKGFKGHFSGYSIARKKQYEKNPQGKDKNMYAIGGTYVSIPPP